MSESMKAAPETAICKALRVRPGPKLQWRAQNAGDARNLAHLLRKATGNKCSHPKRETMWVANSKTTVVGLPKPVGVHIIIPCALNAKHVVNVRL
jgi:hypothetical protein